MKKILFTLITLSILFIYSPLYAEDSIYSGYIIKIKNNNDFRLFSKPGLNEIGTNLYFAQDKEDIDQIEKYFEIEYIEPNYRVELFDTPNDPRYSEQWSLEFIGTQFAWQEGVYGNNVKIAVIDSGLYTEHPDMDYSNIITGFNYFTNTTNTQDTKGHGSFVSGIINAVSNNGIGIAGIADKAKIIPLKCFDSGKETYMDTILLAIYDAVDKYQCDIVNMSFGMSAYSLIFEEAINYAESKNVITVASAGNNGNAVLYYPAAFENVIGVGSIGQNGYVSSTSQKNKSVFVTAPGADILSIANPASQVYVKDSGTSFSAPVISSAAAIAKNIKKDITPEEFRDLLKNACDDKGSLGYDTSYGYGIINIKNMIAELFKDISVYMSPVSLYVNNKDIKTELVIKNNNDNLLKGILIKALYDTKGRFISFEKSDIILVSGERKKISNFFDGQSGNNFKVKYFFWNDIYDLIPLTENSYCEILSNGVN